jgi:hypothetical protein
MPDPALPQAENNRNFFVPQLVLQAGDTFIVRLRDPPTIGLVPISPFGRADDKFVARTLDSMVEVRSDRPQIADVKFQGNNHVYEVTAKRAGEALIQAHRLSGGASLADLRVMVAAKPAADDPSKAELKVDISAGIKDFIAGLKEGLAPHKSRGIDKVKETLLLATAIPGSELLLAPHVSIGVLKGLREGLQSFLDMLKGALRFPFDSKFRDDVLMKAASIIGPWTEIMMVVQSNPAKFLNALVVNGKLIGTALGDEMGKEGELLAQKSAAELCEWGGRIIGLVMFEVVLQILTDLIGIGVIQGARWIGEGSGIIGRLIPRLRPVLGVFEELRNVLRAKLGRTVDVLARLRSTAIDLQSKNPIRAVEILSSPKVYRHSLTGELLPANFARIEKEGAMRLSTGINAHYGEGVYAWHAGKQGVRTYIDIEVPAGTGVETLTVGGESWVRMLPSTGDKLPVKIVGTNMSPADIAFGRTLVK